MKDIFALIHDYYMVRYNNKSELINGEWTTRPTTDQEKDKVLAQFHDAMDWAKANQSRTLHIMFVDETTFNGINTKYPWIKNNQLLAKVVKISKSEVCLACAQTHTAYQEEHATVYMIPNEETWKLQRDLTGAATYEITKPVRNRFDLIKSTLSYWEKTGTIKLPVKQQDVYEKIGGSVMIAPAISMYSSETEDKAVLEKTEYSQMSKNSWKIGLLNCKFKISTKQNIGDSKWKIEATPMNPQYLEKLFSRIQLYSKWFDLMYFSDYNPRDDRPNIGTNNYVYLEQLVYFMEYIKWFRPALVETLSKGKISLLKDYVFGTTRENRWKAVWLEQGDVSSIFLDLNLPYSAWIERQISKEIKRICFPNELETREINKSRIIDNEYEDDYDDHDFGSDRVLDDLEEFEEEGEE